MVWGILTPNRYSRLHTRSHKVHRSLRCGFAPDGTLLYHSAIGRIREFGMTLKPR